MQIPKKVPGSLVCFLLASGVFLSIFGLQHLTAYRTVNTGLGNRNADTTELSPLKYIVDYVCTDARIPSPVSVKKKGTFQLLPGGASTRR